MAEKLSFDAYLGWVNITNPNQIPADARVIGANDLLRYEKLGKDTAAKFAEVDQTLDGMKSDVVISDLIADTNSETRYAVDGMVKEGVAKFQKVIDEVPAKVETQVPPLVAKAIAADGTVASAAAAAVTTEVTGRKLVEGSDPRLPSINSLTEPHLFILRDSQRQETWLGARASDGGPTDWSMQHIQSRIGVGPVNLSQKYLFALTDANKSMTDLTIRSSDGQFDDFVIDRLRPRILKGYTPTDPVPVAAARTYADTKWKTGSEIFPMVADSKRIAGWGSSSMQGIAYAFKTMAKTFGAEYIDGGKGGEQSQHIAARLGSIPALLTVAGGQIPGSGAVPVTSSNVPLSSNLKTFPGTLAGVQGSMSYKAAVDGAPATYIFTRSYSANGDPVDVAPDTPFIPTAIEHRDAVTLLWMGKNNFSSSSPGAEKLAIAQTDASFEWLAPLAKRCIVMGHFVNSSEPPSSVARTQIYATNEAHRRRYGNLYFDVNDYLASEQVWIDAGITPTGQDLAHQALKNKPPSLSSDAGHLNNIGYNAVWKRLENHMSAVLGWY